MKRCWLWVMLMISGSTLLHAQQNTLTTDFDAFLQAYNQWYHKWSKLNQSDPEQQRLYYEETVRLAEVALHWCQQPPGLWRYCWWDMTQQSYASRPEYYVTNRQEWINLLRKLEVSFIPHPTVLYDLTAGGGTGLLYAAIVHAPTEAEKRRWAEKQLALSLEMYTSPRLQWGTDRFMEIQSVPRIVGGMTDFSYQASLRGEQFEEFLNKALAEGKIESTDRFEMLYEIACKSPVPVTLPNPLNEPIYDELYYAAIGGIYTARRALGEVGALPPNDWMLIAGWHIWRLPQDQSYLKVRHHTLYLSLKVLNTLKVRYQRQGTKLVVWNGSRKGAIPLDGRLGFEERGEVWVQVKALKEVAKVFEVKDDDKGQMLQLKPSLPYLPEEGSGAGSASEDKEAGGSTKR